MADEISGKTVMAVFAYMYKANLITRNNLTMVFKAIKEGLPEDVAKYLVEEEGKKS